MRDETLSSFYTHTYSHPFVSSHNDRFGGKYGNILYNSQNSQFIIYLDRLGLEYLEYL